MSFKVGNKPFFTTGRRYSASREEELGCVVLPCGEVVADESGEEIDDLLAGQACATGELVECERRIVLQRLEHQRVGVFIGGDDRKRRLLFASQAEMYGRGEDVLVVDADVGATFPVLLVEREDRPLVGRRHRRHDDRPSVDDMRVEAYRWLWSAIGVGSRMHHVDFLL